MAGTITPPGMTVLPQYQGDYLALQQKQMLAQALLQSATQNQASQIPTNMPVVPKFSIGAGLAQLGQGYLAGKLQHDVSQGYQQLGQQQMAALLGSPDSGAGAPAGSGGASPDASGMSGQFSMPASPANDTAPMQGVSAGMGLNQPSPVDLGHALAAGGNAGVSTAPAQAGGLSGGMFAKGSTFNPSGMDPARAAYLYMTMGPVEYPKAFMAPYSQPTDATRAALAAHADVEQTNRDAIFKSNYVAPLSVRPGGWVRDPHTGQLTWAPQIPAGGMPQFNAEGQVIGAQPMPGAAGITQQQEAAHSVGKAQGTPTQVYNKNTHQMEYTTTFNAAGMGGPTGGGAPPIPSVPNLLGTGAPNASQPPPLPPGMAGTSPSPAPQTGGAGVSVAPLPAPGGMAAAPPLGDTTNADKAQGAGADTMKASYANLQAGRATAGSAIEALQMMQKLATNKSPLVIGALGTAVAPLSNNAAEYEKQRANVIGLLAKQGDLNGSDAARQLVEESVPDYGKPKTAIQEGLQTLINQTKAQQLKADLLTPVYNAGNSKAYTQLENGFDQTITPSLMPSLSNLLSMPSGPSRAQALKAARSDPKMSKALEFIAGAGGFK